MRCSLLFLALFLFCDAIKKKHVDGMKELLQGEAGIFPTCEMILFSEMVNFTIAEKNCEDFTLGNAGDQAGNLATVNDAGKNNAIKLLLNMAYTKNKKKKWDPDQWVWAGMRKVRNNGIDNTREPYDASNWEWTDGSNPDSFHQWMKKQPDQVSDGEYLQNQMRINHDGKWDDTYVHKVHPYACDYQGKYVISSTRATWTEARTKCRAAGLDLAMVRNKKEVKEITAAANYFLGPRVKGKWDASNWIWTGGNDEAVEGVWRWVSNNKTIKKIRKRFRWMKGMPDNAPLKRKGLTEQNALAVSKWGKLDDSYTTVRKRPFACQCPNT